ncbi:glucose-fructose oxidoreductase domain-containing protein 2 isoform X6 [Zootoca vivipara]|uniref:glucose-fructose oxidoreductase domain-containing protein 2 isoform X6 n=1 Tax=Zootoca vivipara TaxID=8524 RepID=UPI00293BC429|nr:glucose-fructose oxidoreductase domain-containing protein 2 isoform X6 [Zootoca vivipara]
MEAKGCSSKGMTTDFPVQSVLVTGSNSGIGLGLVKQFLRLPTPPQWVFATTLDMDGPKSKEIKELACQHQNLVVLQLDVTDLQSIKAAVEQVQRCVGECGLNLLMNNAAVRTGYDLEKENAKDMADIYAVNTIGPLQAFLPLLKMAAQRYPLEGLSCCKAAIINTSSAAGSMEVMAIWDTKKIVAYRCSKAALNMLTKCQSLTYPAYGILCVCIHPGYVKTQGNPEANLTVEESTQGIINVLSTLSEVDNGTFVDWEGRRVPWNYV